MKDSAHQITYPRLRFRRGISRVVGKLLLKLFFKIEIVGQENYPPKGPLIIVANHEAVMESVLLTITPPWQVEMLGQADIPHEPLSEFVSKFYGFIPIRRGRIERRSLELAINVLRQDGILGLFPEGGIWEAGQMSVHSGVSWLSYRGKAHVLPVGFSPTKGTLGAALKFKRPKICMYVGQMIPPAVPPTGTPRKQFFNIYANQILEAIRELIPSKQRNASVSIQNEKFELIVKVFDYAGCSVEIPKELAIIHDQALTKVLHRPGILKIFTVNLELPTLALENLDEEPTAREIEIATKSIQNYLNTENPYLLTYRFGAREAEMMYKGLEELNALALWVSQAGYSMHLTPIRRYTIEDQEEEIVQTTQGSFKGFM
jgi:1-acyl-sn-glycerol-3-phosphate acyltransferase